MAVVVVGVMVTMVVLLVTAIAVVMQGVLVVVLVVVLSDQRKSSCGFIGITPREHGWFLSSYITRRSHREVPPGSVLFLLYRSNEASGKGGDSR